jgi:hypothetical protein
MATKKRKYTIKLKQRKKVSRKKITKMVKPTIPLTEEKSKPWLFKKGNNLWELRSKHGRNKLFETPQLMWEAACEYFKWCEDNPLFESKGFAFQGVVTTETFPKMRAMTLSQLCFYLHCDESYFRVFKKMIVDNENKTDNNKDFLTVIARIEQVIYNQKFQGAAADLLNANIISRDLGLIDRGENNVNIDIPIIKVSKELNEALNDL